MVLDAQVRLLRRKMKDGMSQEAAAAAVGMSVRTARKWQRGPLPGDWRKERHWRTRQDPFDGVWESEVVAFLRSDRDGVLEAKTLLEHLQEKHPGQFSDGQVRTLQRRVREWRALHGPPKEVYFEQQHEPGREAAVDFTDCSGLGVVVGGQAFPHLLFHFVLSFSGWTWVALAFGETFEALVAGVQEALWNLGGVPRVLRSDNLSAATHQLKQTGGRSLTTRFKAVLDHYGLASTRIRPGESHENGVVEKTHHLVKSALAQALVLRGSSHFDDAAEYLAFARAVVARARGRRGEDAFEEERSCLRPLPSAPVPSYTTHHPRARQWSTVRIGGRVYSVPSRLIGHVVEVRQHADVVEVFFRGRLVETMPRLRGDRTWRIDYRHIIWSLVRKPGAFARYRYREELFPSLTFRKAYDALSKAGDRADIEYLRVLHLAASTMEVQVERALQQLLERGERFDYAVVKAIAEPEQPHVPEVSIGAPDLAAYDRLIVAGER
jgi:hypothetical protein